MKLITSSLVAAGAATLIAVCSVGAAQASVLRGDETAAEPAPVVQAHVRAVAGRFAYEMTATASEILDAEHFGRIRDGIGSSGRPDVAPDRIRSMGFVAGGSSSVTGVSGAHLSGVAGADVTGITVVTASGARVPAVMDAGIWAAAWQGDPDADGGRARIEYTTADGATRSTSTDAVDWIAADQRASQDA